MATAAMALLALTACAGPEPPQSTVFKSRGRINHTMTPEQVQLLDSIQQKTFLYFLHEHHPRWGIVKDRSTDGSPSSIAATGFGMPCLAIGVERRWISRQQAAQITVNTLDFFNASVHSAATNATGYKGFYYHFLDMDSGTRAWNCELSSVDTGLLAMGFLFARNYYDRNNEVENRIRWLADKLVGRIEWDFMGMPPTGEYAQTISMGWTPEKGLHSMGWSGYNEALFLYILAAGSGMADAPQRYQAWLKSYRWLTPYPGLSHVAFPPLFGHQFSQAFIDFRGLVDAYLKGKGIDYFENSRRATLVQRQYAIDNPHGWVGYDALCWGVTACDGPSEKYNADGRKFLGYAGRGTSGPEWNYFDDGTIAPYGPLASLPFAPEVVLPTIQSMAQKHGDALWGKYGLVDAFNLTAKWFGTDFLGIDQGPLLIMVENFRTGLVWDCMMRDPVIQRGLARLGFAYLK